MLDCAKTEHGQGSTGTAAERVQTLPGLGTVFDHVDVAGVQELSIGLQVVGDAINHSEETAHGLVRGYKFDLFQVRLESVNIQVHRHWNVAICLNDLDHVRNVDSRHDYL